MATPVQPTRLGHNGIVRDLGKTTKRSVSGLESPIPIVRDSEGPIQVPASLLSSSVIFDDRGAPATGGFQPPKDGEFDAKFFKGLVIERSLNDQENALLSIVENAARRHGFDNILSYLGGIPEEYLRRLAKLKREAKGKGISSRTFYDFFELMMYSKKVTMARSQHLGCVCDIIIAGSTIAMLVQDLFNGGETRCKDGVRMNGIFGKQGVVRTEEDLQACNDLMPFMYIMATSFNHHFDLPVYYLFFGETPNPVSIPSRDTRNAALDGRDSHRGGRFFLEHNSGPWFNAKIILERSAKFMAEAAEMCLEVTQEPAGVILADLEGKPHFVPVITSIYDLETMCLWHVEQVHGHIVAQKMEEYLEDHIDHFVYPGLPMFSRKEIISRHIDRLTSHSSHGDEHLQLRHSSFKKVGCVDGRQHNNCSELGALLSEREFENVLLDSHTTRIDMVFHTECGYVYTAITLHKLFHALRIGIDPEDKLTLGRAVSFINTLMRSPWVSRERELFIEFISHVDLTKVSPSEKIQKQVYDDLYSFFTDNSGTLRYATTHMMDRQLFQIEQGFPVMTATLNVEIALRRHGIEIEPEDAKVLVVEETARIDRQTKTKWLAKHKSRIERSRIDETLPSLEWKMEDLVTGRSYFIPAKFALEQTKAELSNMKRQDVVTHVWFDIIRPDSIAPDHIEVPTPYSGGSGAAGIDLFLHPIGTDPAQPLSIPGSPPDSSSSLTDSTSQLS